MLKMSEDGDPLCPACGKALSGAYIKEQFGTSVVYQHSDMIARAFTTPCVIHHNGHESAMAALHELPADWASPPTPLSAVFH